MSFTHPRLHTHTPGQTGSMKHSRSAFYAIMIFSLLVIQGLITITTIPDSTIDCPLSVPNAAVAFILQGFFSFSFIDLYFAKVHWPRHRLALPANVTAQMVFKYVLSFL